MAQAQHLEHEHIIESHPPFQIHDMLRVQRVSSSDVWLWLADGWADFRACWRVSCAYAALFVVLGVFITFGWHYLEMPYLILPSLSGFLLVGPALGVGFYEISRRHRRGEPCTLMDALRSFKRNTLGIMGLGVALVFLLQVWIRVSFTIFAISFPGIMPEWSHIIARMLTVEGLYFAVFITAVGSVFAAVVFFAAAFAMPLMVDKGTMLLPSMMTSAFAVYNNGSAMIVWAALIVIFTGIGLVTGFVGLVISFPLIGHATWHAYRRVIDRDMT